MDPAGADVQAAYYGFLAEAGAELGTVAAPLPQEDLEAAAAAGATTSGGKGRKRVKQLDDGDSDGDLSDEEDEGGRKGGRKRSDSSRASQKASREKLRREKINDRFIELAMLVEPNKEPKTDKLTVLSEAIRTVQQLQGENHQLKQLNKFLEEKTASMERDRAQAMYFQMQAGMMGQPAGGMMMQQPGGMMMQQPGGMMMQPPPMQPAGMMMQAPPAMMMAQQQQPPGVARTHSSGAIALPPQPQQQHQQQPDLSQQQPQQQQLDQQQPQQQQQQQQPPAGYAPVAVSDAKVPMGMMGGGAMAGQPGGPVYWQSMVPQNMLDANQDSLLRPPAA